MFAVEFDIEKKKELEGYVQDINDKLETFDLARNPFTGKVIGRENILVVDMTPIYPNTAIMGIASFVITMFFTGLQFSFWLLIPAFFFIALIPRTALFSYWVFRKGAIKKGYTGKFKKVALTDVIRRFI